MIDLILCQRSSRRDMVPFLKTASAAASRGMLRDKAGVSAHGSLLAVIGNMGRSETETDEVAGMPDDRIQPFFIDIPALLFPQMKACTKT